MTIGHSKMIPALRARNAGFSLIEIMVAVTIGILLLAGVIQIFLANQRSYRFQQALARVEETGRYSIDRVTRDLRMAGYQGCGGSVMKTADYRKNPPATFDQQFTTGVRGFQVDSSGKIQFSGLPLLNKSKGTGKSGYVVTPDKDTEGILISHMNDTGVTFQDTDTPSLQIQDEGDKDREEFKKCDVVFMVDRDCGFGRAFIAGSSEDSAVMNFNGTGKCSTGNEGHKGLKPAWPGDTQGARALKVRRFIYYIRESNGEPTLHRWTGTGQGKGSGKTEELVEGVKAMHVEYGVDTGKTDDAIDDYVPESSVTDWDNVVATRVSFLVRSREENVTDSPQTVSWPPGSGKGNDYDCEDNRVCQVFTTTVAFRNRLP